MDFDLDAFDSADMDSFSNNFTTVVSTHTDEIRSTLKRPFQNTGDKTEESPDPEVPPSPPETPTKSKKRENEGTAKPAPTKKKQAITSKVSPLSQAGWLS